jgi:hypothetical protein
MLHALGRVLASKIESQAGRTKMNQRSCKGLGRSQRAVRPFRRARLLLQVLEGRDLPSTYYVAPTGSDTAAGTAAAPWQTLQQAANTVQAGDTVIVRAGNYTGFIMGWDFVTAGTAAAPITFEADPAAAVGSVVINARDNQTACGIDVEPGCNYITVNGFTIQGGGAGGIGTYPNKGSGIKVTGAGDAVLNCTVGNVDYGFGIFAGNAADFLLQGNTVFGTGSHANTNYGHAIYLADNSDGAVVRGNILHDNDYIGIHINGDIGDTGVAPGLVTHALIEGNLIYNNGQNGINADGLASSTIRNNLIYGYQGFGICMYQIDAGAPSTNNFILNNTIVSTVAGAGAALRIKDAGTGNTARNNILLGGGSIAEDFSTDSLPGLVSDYNVVSSLIQNDDTGNTQTFTQWQAQGHDAHSVTAAATSVFLNAAGNDYHLKTGSPAVDAGTATGAPAVDIVGVARPQGAGYDIGAYELPVSVSAAGALQFGSATFSVNETAGVATIAVTRSGGSTGAVTVHYATADGTAAAGVNYTAVSGTLSWANGDSSTKSFTVPVLDSHSVFDNKTVNLTLSAPTGGAVFGTTVTASLSIADDDAPPSVNITGPANGTYVTATVPVTVSTAHFAAGVAGVQYMLDGGNLGAEVTTAPYSLSWNTATSANGTYTLIARARDAAGNVVTSAPVTVIVVNAAANGLVGAWGFNEGSGATTVDTTGAMVGTISGATWTTAGKFGSALSFNGTNASVTIPDNPLLELTTGMTVEAWVMPTAAASGLTTVAMKEQPGGMDYTLYAANGAALPPAGYVDQSGTDTSVAGSTALPLNAWSYLTATYDGAHLKIYVNGTLVRSKALTGAISTSNSPFRIGGNSVLGQYFTGLIDEVRVYNKALTQAQVQTDMAAPVGAVAPPVSVASVAINDGTAQRSEVRSIAVTFSGLVTFAGGIGNAAAAFQLAHVTNGNNVVLSATVSADSQWRTVVTLAFSGAETDSVSAQNGVAVSLADGRYTLNIASGAVTGANGLALDGDGNGAAGGDYVSPTDTLGGGAGQLHLYRLFGDATGDGIVDQQDLGQFRTAFNATPASPIFDANNDGAVDQQDLGQFRSRFNSNVFPTGPTVAPPPPTVAAVAVNDGAAQRSEVRSLSVTFSGPVTFAGGAANAAAAFRLNHRSDSNNVDLTAAVSADAQGRTVVTLTFGGAETDAVSGRNGGLASLADGRYTLTVLSGAVTGSNGLALAGGGANGNYVSPADTLGGGAGQLHLYRLFGDVNGDGVVDQVDLGQFRRAINASVGSPFYLSFLDADNSGTVDMLDLGQFRTRLFANVF